MSSEELQFKLLEYHHRAMESRRAIQVQIFLGTIAVYWLLIHNARVLISEWAGVQMFMQIGFGVVWFLYLIFTIQVEGWNKHDRQKYLALEKSLWASSAGGSLAEEKECWCSTLWRSWAGVVSVIMISFLAYVCWRFVGSLN